MANYRKRRKQTKNADDIEAFFFSLYRSTIEQTYIINEHTRNEN